MVSQEARPMEWASPKVWQSRTLLEKSDPQVLTGTEPEE